MQKASFQDNPQGLAKLKQGFTPVPANEHRFLGATPATSSSIYAPGACVDNMQRACLLLVDRRLAHESWRFRNRSFLGSFPCVGVSVWVAGQNTRSVTQKALVFLDIHVVYVYPLLLSLFLLEHLPLHAILATYSFLTSLLVSVNNTTRLDTVSISQHIIFQYLGTGTNIQCASQH